jgi:catechol 2,3-dioxygenase-like lactoylglutathione lyase family enzyme
MLVAPVSRFLSVADLNRTTAFYRDVLGFEGRPAREEDAARETVELVNGPARIVIGTHEQAIQ